MPSRGGEPAGMVEGLPPAAAGGAAASSLAAASLRKERPPMSTTSRVLSPLGGEGPRGVNNICPTFLDPNFTLPCSRQVPGATPSTCQKYKIRVLNVHVIVINIVLSRYYDTYGTFMEFIY